MTPFFIRLLMSVMLSSLLAGVANARQALDILITGGHVYNMPSDTVVGITDGKFSYLGSFNEVTPLVNQATHHIDANGASIYPGFIELHTHLFDNISFGNVACVLNPHGGLSGLEDCLVINQQLKFEKWLIGHSKGLLDTDLDGQTPRQWLDGHFPDRPVVICEPHTSVLWLNSSALERMRIDRNTLDPIGGRILRSDLNNPNGVLLGSLTEAVLEKALETHHISHRELLKRYPTAAERLQRHGVTSIGEAESLWKKSNMLFWEHLEQADQLDFRVSVRPRLSPNQGVNAQLIGLSKIYRNDLSSKLIINQVMLNIDGQHEFGTARISKPYRNPKISNEPKGLFYFSPTELNSWLHRLDEIGYGAYMYAEGDAAVEAALYSIQNARRQGDDQRFILTGMHFINTDLYPLFRQNGITASFSSDIEHNQFECSNFVHLDNSADDKIQMIKIEDLIKHGASVALSSGGYDRTFLPPLVRISENLKLGSTGLNDIHRAIESYTIEPAKALGIESITGSIVIGKSADIVMIDKNLTTISVEEIATAKVLMTMLQGEITFSTGMQ
ncbi:amidohydrolase [Photobacterium nomapromontoriensis]|uniref:amidohydrolase n=1 Tax=Photobacterium nomapromontoriensis TaxID=2910237 RepID=UPI003D0DDEB8